MALLDEIKKVNSWEQAVALYNKYGKKSGLKLRFSRHRSPALEKKLVYELTKLVKREERKIAAKPEPKAKDQSSKKKSGGSGSGAVSNPENLSSHPQNENPVTPENPEVETNTERIQDHPQELVKLYREQTHLHQQLALTSSDQQRKEAAFRILEISDEIVNFKSEGRINLNPVDIKSTLPANEMDMMKMMNNNRAYISKFKDDSSKAQKVAYRTLQNIEIEKIINQPPKEGK